MSPEGGLAADLHMHTHYSDGCLSPQQLVQHAQQQGMGMIAITDHDTTQGIAEAMRCGQALGLQILPGIEISSEAAGQEYHILGYGIDGQQLREQELLWKKQRRQRMHAMVDRLSAIGVYVDRERIEEIAGPGVLGRPHIAQALVDAGYAEDQTDAFQHYVGRGCPGYVPRPPMTPVEAIQLVQSADGIAIWAHPGQQFSWSRLQELCAYGLRGIEVWHPDHHQEQMQRLAEQIRPTGLLATGGSDFHSLNYGPALGSCRTPLWAVQRLLRSLN